MFPLDHRGPMTRLGHRPGEVLARFPAPNNEDLITFNVLHFFISFTYPTKNELEKLARELSRYTNIVALFKKESYAHGDK
jgi:hypothetical protein